MKILFCAQRMPYPLNHGGNVHIYNICNQISKKHDIYLYSLEKQKNEFYLEELKKTTIFKEIYFHNDQNNDQSQNAYSLPFIVTYNIEKVLPSKRTQKIRDEISTIIETNNINIVHISDPILGQILGRQIKIPALLDLIDSYSLYHYREYKYSNGFVKRVHCFANYLNTMSMEMILTRLYGNITVVSPIDKKFLDNLGGISKVQVIPNGVDTNYFFPAKKDVKCGQNIIFFGAMDYPPNIDAAHYICNTLFPQILKKIPELKLLIVGRDPPESIVKYTKNKSITVTGTVDDIRPYIQSATLCLLIMRKGSGIKNKILEAMAMGKTIVTTPVGAESLNLAAQKALIVGRDTQDLVDKTIYYIYNEEERNKLGAIAQEIVKSEYSWESISEKFEKIYYALLTK